MSDQRLREREALAAGTHEPAVDDFGNQYLTPLKAPLVDGCRIVNRGDGFSKCQVHYRYWETGTERCPGANT